MNKSIKISHTMKGLPYLSISLYDNLLSKINDIVLSNYYNHKKSMKLSLVTHPQETKDKETWGKSKRTSLWGGVTWGPQSYRLCYSRCLSGSCKNRQFCQTPSHSDVWQTKMFNHWLCNQKSPTWQWDLAWCFKRPRDEGRDPFLISLRAMHTFRLCISLFPSAGQQVHPFISSRFVLSHPWTVRGTTPPSYFMGVHS